MDTLYLRNASAEMNGDADGKHRCGKHNKGQGGGLKKLRCPLQHLTYFKHCLLIKVPSASADAQIWMSSSAARTGARRGLSDHNQLLETHLESRTVSSLPRGTEKCRSSSFPISLSDRAPTIIRRLLGMNMHHAISGDFSYHAMAVGSEQLR